MNKIRTTQLDETQLKRLAAQKQLYSVAKTNRAFQIGVITLTPLIFALLAAFCSMSPAYAAIGGVTGTVLSIMCWIPWRESLQTKAAKIQELFDCEVLELDWRELTVGSRLEIETVERYADKYRRKFRDFSRLENWYPEDVGTLPLWLGRIVCQRANCYWDAELRQRYARCVFIVLLVMVLVVVFLSLKSGWNKEKIILAIVNPIMPTAVVGVQEYKENIASATRLDKLKDYSNKLWEKALAGSNPNQLTCDSRELQDEIYNHRRRSPLLFDWVYQFLRNKDEELMNKAADEMVNEALKCLRKQRGTST